MNAITLVDFRANPDLISAVENAAAKTGESRSDSIRAAVAERLDPEPVDGSEIVSATTLMLAARGDIGAQRAMANRAYEHFLAVAAYDDDMAAIALTECLTFARLAALHGATSDCETLVFVLARYGEWQAERCRRDIGQRLDATGLVLADAMADGGHEAMAAMVADCRGLPAETIEEATRLKPNLCEC